MIHTSRQLKAFIMDEADYPGIRVTLDTTLETMRTPLKIDFSTGDVILTAVT